MIGAGLACLVGTLVMLLSVIDARDDAFPSGRLVAFVAGLAFFLAGVAIAVPLFERGNGSLLQRSIVAFLLSAFAALPILLVAGGRALPLSISAPVLLLLALVAWDGLVRGLIPRRGVRFSLYAALVLGAGAWTRRARPEPPLAVSPTTFEPVVLALERPMVTAGDRVRVSFDRPITMPPGYGYWIAIVVKEAPVHAQGLWRYVAPGDRGAELTAPEEAGEYEVRLHHYLNAVLASAPLLVAPRARPPFLEAPEATTVHPPAEAPEDPRAHEGPWGP